MLNHLSVFLAISGAGGIIFSLFFIVSSHIQMKRLETILQDFLETGETGGSGLEETRESKLESQLRRLLHRAVQSEQRALGERNRVAALLSDLSHQLKTPLANVMMYAELLEDNGLSKQERDAFIKETGVQAKKMHWLIESMLKASRLEKGSVVFLAGYTGIKDTISKAVGAIYAKSCDKQIDVIVEPFADRRLYHNPAWTAEALANILDNAIKYSPEGSRITMCLQPLETYTCIEIKDEGPGIGHLEFNDIFKRFYRGSNAGNVEGSGLGLYLSQLILNQEKGYVTVKSRQGEGACFQVYLLNELT